MRFCVLYFEPISFDHPQKRRQDNPAPLIYLRPFPSDTCRFSSKSLATFARKNSWTSTQQTNVHPQKKSQQKASPLHERNKHTHIETSNIETSNATLMTLIPGPATSVYQPNTNLGVRYIFICRLNGNKYIWKKRMYFIRVTQQQRYSPRRT